MGLLSRFRPQRKFTAEQIQQRREAMLDRTRQYLVECCAEPLQLPASFELVPATGGLESIVYFLQADGCEPVVVRLVEHPRRMRKRIAGHTVLRNVDAPVPAVLYQDLSKQTMQHLGSVVMVEECLPGVTFHEYDDARGAAAMLGRTFAQIHNVQYHPGGDFFEPAHVRRWIRKDSVGPWLRRRRKRWLANYREVAGQDADAVEAWLNEHPAEAWRQSLRLCVGDVTAGNLLFSPDGVGIIDIYGVCFSSAVYEAAQLQMGGVLKRDPVLGSEFLKGYQQMAAPELWEEIRRSLTLCQVLLALKATSRRFSTEPGGVNDYLMQLVRGEHDPISNIQTAYTT